MIKISEQNRRDLTLMAMILGLYMALMFTSSLILSRSLNIEFDNSRHVVGAVFTTLFLLYLARGLALHYWQALLGLVGFVLLVGSYGAASELYIKHFTVLGMGELPLVFSWIYLSLVFASIGVTFWHIKKALIG